MKKSEIDELKRNLETAEKAATHWRRVASEWRARVLEKEDELIELRSVIVRGQTQGVQEEVPGSDD